MWVFCSLTWLQTDNFRHVILTSLCTIHKALPHKRIDETGAKQYRSNFSVASYNNTSMYNFNANHHNPPFLIGQRKLDIYIDFWSSYTKSLKRKGVCLRLLLCLGGMGCTCTSSLKWTFRAELSTSSVS